MKKLILVQYFNDHKLSDINSWEYFENKHSLSLLTLMLDERAWTSHLPFRPQLWDDISDVVCPILCWFDRQLVSYIH